MASTITNLINTINVAFPIAGQDNDSEGFRTNFNIIRQSLLATDSEIESLQSTLSTLGGAVYVTATHIVAIEDVAIGGNTITVDASNNLVVTAGGVSGTIVMRPNTVTAYGAFGLTDSVTSLTTGTFAVDNVRNIQIGATITFPDVAGLRTVTAVDSTSNYITVTPEFSDTPPPFAINDALLFVNPFFSDEGQAGDLIVNGNIYATGNITGFWNSSDRTLKENIRTIDNALEKVRAIDGVFYDWKDSVLAALPAGSGVTKQDTGVIAQQVQQQLPEVVFTKSDGTLAVRYEKMIGLLIESIKELSAEVETLKKQLNK
jgi:hypothetical protein